MIPWPRRTILICLRRTYYRLSRYINAAVLSSVMYKCMQFIWCFVAEVIAMIYCRNWSREVGDCGNTIVCLTQVWQSLLPLFVTKRSSLPSKLGKRLCSTTTCMYKHTFCLSSAKCWFCSLVPIVKCAHCRHYDLACLSVANNTNTRDCIVGNGHILQWELMSKINILRSWDKKIVYKYT